MVEGLIAERDGRFDVTRRMDWDPDVFGAKHERERIFEQLRQCHVIRDSAGIQVAHMRVGL